MSTGAEKRYTVHEYLDLERASEIKHEYFDGEIFAMARGSAPHSLITTNWIGELRNSLKVRRCQVFSSDLQVVCPTGLRTYPDVSVVCDQPELEDKHQDTLLNPLLIVEVLSKSTEAYDRGRKFDHYRTIPSLQEYVLVAQDRIHVDHYARQETGQWLLTTFTDSDESVKLPALDCAIPLVEIYANVAFEKKVIG